MTIFLPEAIATTYDGHLRVIADHLDPSLGAPLDLPDDLRFCFLCFTNRCGSNYLAQVLASSEALNEAQESYNDEEVLRVVQRHGLRSFREYVSQVARASAVGGRFFVKTAIYHLVVLARTGVLDDVLPRAEFVVLERLDKLSQAISFSIAEQTQQWTSFLDAPASAQPKYDFARILSLIQSITQQMKAFDEVFALNGIVPIHLTYESLVANPSVHAAHVAHSLGIANTHFDLRKVRTKRQRSHLNEEWRERFLHDVSAAALQMRLRVTVHGSARTERSDLVVDRVDGDHSKL